MLLDLLRKAPRLFEACKEAGALQDIRSTCREGRLMATAEVTRLVVDCEHADISIRLRELLPLLGLCKIRCLDITLHEDFYGECTLVDSSGTIS